MVTGFDKGEEFPTRFAASVEEPLCGIFTSRGTSFFEFAWSALARVFVFATGEELDEDWAGFPLAIDTLVASRLLDELGRE